MFFIKSRTVILLIFFLQITIAPFPLLAELRIDSVTPGVGKIGEELEIMIEGTGFDANTKVDLHIFDGSEKQIIGSLNTKGFAMDVKVVGQTAFVAAGESGLLVVDVSDSSNPEIIGVVDTPGEAQNVIISNNTAYVADGVSGIQVMDVSDPYNPAVIGALNTPGDAKAIALDGDIAYLADYYGFYSIDISTPSDPTGIKYITSEFPVLDIAIADGAVFLAGGDSGFVAVDISNPSAPVVIDSVDTPGAVSSFQINEGVAFVADLESGLKVIDVSDQSEMKIIGSLITPDAAWDIAIVNNTAFIADGYKGLQVIDVSDPVNPYIIGAVDTPGTNFAMGVTVSENRVYIAGGADLSILPAPACINNIELNSNNLISATIPPLQMPARYSVRLYNETESDLLPNAIDYTLEIDFIYPAIGKTGEDLNVMIHGNGFDVNTRIALFPDCSNRHLITGSVKTPDIAEDVAVMGDIAFVAADFSGIQVIDVSDHSNPAIIASLETPGAAAGVTAADNKAYVSDGYGLHVIDVSDPLYPNIIGSIETPGFALKAALRDDIAFVADGDGGLQVIDASNPSRPLIIGAVETPGFAWDVTLSDQTVFVASDDGGVQAIDVSDPSHPSIINILNTPGSSSGVDFSGNTLFVADGEGGLQTFNIVDPNNPQPAGSVDTPWASGIMVKDGTAFVADASGGLYLIDITDPYQPVTAGSVNTSGKAWSVAVNDATAFVAADDSGLQVIDVSGPLNNCSMYTANTEICAWKTAVMEDVVFMAADYSGLQVIDMSDPSNPAAVGYVDIPGCSMGVTLYDEKAFVAADEGGLSIIDINDPKAPEMIGSVDTPGGAVDVDVSGEIAYVADYLTLQAIDVSNPQNPVIIGSVSTPGVAWGVSVVENTAFVSAGDSGLHIIDVSNPANPAIINTVETPGYAYDAVTMNNKVYVADYASGIQIVDVSDLSAPSIIGSVDTAGLASNVALTSNMAYVADAYEGIKIIDISDPSKPVMIGSMNTRGQALGVFIADQKAYVADGADGLSVLPVPYEIETFEIIDSGKIQASIPGPPIAGHHGISVFNGKDRDEMRGAISFLESSEYDRHSGDRVIIVAGRKGPSDPLWESTRKNANHAYKTLLRRGYTHQAILYLSSEGADVDGDGINDVDMDASIDNLSYGFEQWLFETGSASNGVIFYMIGHGDTKAYQLKDSETVSAEKVDGWIDTTESALDGRVVVIYDGCLSGSFYDVLDSGSDGSRIVITSTSADENACFIDDGEQSFSYRFWSDILEGYKIGGAYSRARAEMTTHDQNALISNVALADTLCIGVGDFFAPVGPRISRISPETLILNGESAAMIEVTASSPNGVKSVKAVIIPPDLNQLEPGEPLTDLPGFILTDPNHDGVYEGVYNDYSQVGEYTITMTVEDMKGFRSYDPDRKITVIQTTLPGDINIDDELDLADVITTLKVAAGETGLNIQTTAEVSNDERIGITDAIIILRKIGGW